jgi:hypothetical protein
MELTPWSRCLPWRLTGPHLVKKFPKFYGTRRFIIVFTSTSHLSLSWASSTQSVLQSYVLTIYCNNFLPSATRFYKWSPSLRFIPHTCYVTYPSYSSWFDRCGTTHPFKKGLAVIFRWFVNWTRIYPNHRLINISRGSWNSLPSVESDTAHTPSDSKRTNYVPTVCLDFPTVMLLYLSKWSGITLVDCG